MGNISGFHISKPYDDLMAFYWFIYFYGILKPVLSYLFKSKILILESGSFC